MPGAPAAQPAESPEITELRQYVTGVLIEGYSPDEVRTHLLEIGWDAGTADKILNEAYKEAQAQQGQ